jgi:L-asparaginase/Glu-tRNA(Gln) amidotransferase subunit D
MICTGGTILSSVERATAVVDGRWVPHLAQAAAEAGRGIEIDVEVHEPFMLHSEEVQPCHWLDLASLVEKVAPDVDGVIVLHGTDTAAYTAAALHYLLAEVEVPVVVTGAMVPPGLPDSDAERAVRAAAHVALAPLAPAAYLTFCEPDGDALVHLGVRARKTGDPAQPFASIGRPPVARVGDAGLVPVAPVEVRVSPPLSVRSDLDDRVTAIECHPGQRLVPALRCAREAGARAVVLALYPGATAATGPGDVSAEAAVREARAAGLVVVGVTRGAGRPAPVSYPSADALAHAGLVHLELPLEAALPKVMWALAQRESPAAVAQLARMPIRIDCD